MSTNFGWEGKGMVLITNRKSHTGFRLIPTSMTLNDLERCNSPYFVFFSPNSIALLANYVTVVEDRPIMSAKYHLPITFGLNGPTQQLHGLFAIAKLLVNTHLQYSSSGSAIHPPLLLKSWIPPFGDIRRHSRERVR